MQLSDPPVLALGIDGCAAGWVVASRSDIQIVGSLDEALALNVGPAALVLGIDMPIGLPTSAPRACDAQARAFLKHRASTIFSTPPRLCLGAPTHAAANVLCRTALGKGLSIQAFHLLPKIAELDQMLDSPAADEPDVHRSTTGRTTPVSSWLEVHPECSFARMNGDVPLSPKRSAEGAAQRRRLLAARDLVAPQRLAGAAADDLLDALAVLWSTERWLAGAAVTFGDGTHDSLGRPMRIVS
jgi:predicted RNase H-like nuclease